jgi:hypothetical protein
MAAGWELAVETYRWRRCRRHRPPLRVLGRSQSSPWFAPPPPPRSRRRRRRRKPPPRGGKHAVDVPGPPWVRQRRAALAPGGVRARNRESQPLRAADGLRGRCSGGAADSEQGGGGRKGAAEGGGGRWGAAGGGGGRWKATAQGGGGPQSTVLPPARRPAAGILMRPQHSGSPSARDLALPIPLSPHPLHPTFHWAQRRLWQVRSRLHSGLPPCRWGRRGVRGSGDGLQRLPNDTAAVGRDRLLRRLLQPGAAGSGGLGWLDGVRVFDQLERVDDGTRSRAAGANKCQAPRPQRMAGRHRH